MAQDFTALGIATPRLDAELLLCHALRCDRVRLYMDMQRPLERGELEAVRALVVRRRAREPVAYILGKREFYRYELEVTRDVLVPRPETELLCDRALELLPESATRALDLCTGSGAIALVLALMRPSLEVDATDISPDALAVAARNLERHGAQTRVRLHRGDLFAALPEQREYPLIVANPPYVAERDRESLAPEVERFEPHVALFGGRDGLDVIRRLCAESPSWLAPGGVLLFEIGHDQATETSALLAATGAFCEPVIHKDLARIDRLVEARLKPS